MQVFAALFNLNTTPLNAMFVGGKRSETRDRVLRLILHASRSAPKGESRFSVAADVFLRSAGPGCRMGQKIFLMSFCCNHSVTFQFTLIFSRTHQNCKQIAAMSILLKKIAPMKPLLIPTPSALALPPVASRQPDEAKEPSLSTASQQKIDSDANDDSPKTVTAAKKPAKAPLLFSSITTTLVASAGVAQTSSKQAPGKPKRKEAPAGDSAPAKKKKVASASSAKAKAPASSLVPEKSEAQNDVRVKPGRSAYAFYSAAVFGNYANLETLGEKSKSIGLAWKNLDESEKQPYQELAEKDKDRYAAECAAAGVDPKTAGKKPKVRCDCQAKIFHKMITASRIRSPSRAL